MNSKFVTPNYGEIMLFFIISNQALKNRNDYKIKNNVQEISKHLNIHPNSAYLKLSVVFFIIWLSFKGPIRNFTETAPELNLFLGFAPNLFAGITLVFWQTYITSSKPLLTFICATTILFLAEFVQLFIDTQTADGWDLLASLIGCALAIGVVLLIEKKPLKQE